jgi:hypothetical protein
MDDRIDPALRFYDTTDQRAKKRSVGRPQLLALHLFAQTMRLELGDDGRKRRPASVHLVERLHGA